MTLKSTSANWRISPGLMLICDSISAEKNSLPSISVRASFHESFTAPSAGRKLTNSLPLRSGRAALANSNCVSGPKPWKTTGSNALGATRKSRRFQPLVWRTVALNLRWIGNSPGLSNTSTKRACSNLSRQSGCGSSSVSATPPERSVSAAPRGFLTRAVAVSVNAAVVSLNWPPSLKSRNTTPRASGSAKIALSSSE